MARARNIKPGFFMNDVLGSLHPLARLLFAGLWTVCDRSGRVEDRPRKIKAETLPYDECDADELLEQLREAGFIARYKAGDKKVIQVLAWDKHQTPHQKEAPSTLPAQDEAEASTRQGQDSTESGTSKESLIVDCGLLIPDTGLQRSDADASPDKPGAASSKRGTRLAADWTLPDEWAGDAIAIRPEWTVAICHRVADAFRDYWISQPGQKGVKADWLATWRNWARNENRITGPPRESAKDADKRRIMESIRGNGGSDSGTTIEGTAKRVA